MINKAELYLIDTVDELVERYLSDGKDNEYNTCKNIIRYDAIYFEWLLNKKTNLPSKYDLLFVKACNNYILTEPHYATFRDWFASIRSILEFYKNRKDI